MSSQLVFPISTQHSISLAPSNGGYAVEVLNDSQVIAQGQIPDLQRLLKRPGSIVSANPIELRNDQRTIVVRVRGRVMGGVAKHDIVAAL